MKSIVWDIESNGLIVNVSTIHCMAFYDIGGKKIKAFDSTTTDGILQGVRFLIKMLDKGYRIIGHNVSYDAVAIWKLYEEFNLFKYINSFHDTIIHSKLIYPKFKLLNCKFDGEISDKKSLYSLKSWGERLEQPKDDYTGGWDEFSNEMLQYNKQDVKTTAALFTFLQNKRKVSKKVLNLEFFASVIATIQTMNGWVVDKEKIEALDMKYEVLLRQVDIQLAETFDSYYVEKGSESSIRNSSMWIECDLNTPHSVLKGHVSTLKHYKNGKVKGTTCKTLKYECLKFYRKVSIQYLGERTNIELKTFKAGSRSSIISFMDRKYNWIPTDRTDAGALKLDMDVFKGLEYGEAPLLYNRFKIVKKRSEVTTLLKTVRDYGSISKIHHNVDVLGASSTTRMSSSIPNLQQVSSDEEFRELFIVPKGFKFIGTDLASVELMLLAIQIAPFDDGRMLDIMVNGDKSKGTDLHSINASVMGVSRKDAKGILYAILYASGVTLIGYTTWDGVTGKAEVTAEEFDYVKRSLTRRCENIDGVDYFRVKKGLHVPMSDDLVYMTIYGKSIKEKLVGGIKGFQALLDSLIVESDNNGSYIKSLDDRLIAKQSNHSLLNYKLQGNGAVFFKTWVKLFYTEMFNELTYGEDFLPYAMVHDEMVIAVRDDVEIVYHVKKLLDKKVKEASELYGFKIPILCDTAVGDSWTVH